MSVQPIDFLISAKLLAAENTEISKRNALSRSYYAAYHISNEKFPLDVDFKPLKDDVGVHKKYISYLKSADAGSLQRIIGLELDKLRIRRVKADYRLDTLLKTDDLALQLTTTDKVFKLLITDNEPSSTMSTSI